MSNSGAVLADASAILAILLEEPEKPSIISATRGREVVSAGCLSWEIGNALTAMVKRKRITEDEVLQIWESFGLIVWRKLAEDIRAALALACRHGLYAYDAYYIEAAIRFRCEVLTLDQRVKAICNLENVALLEVS